MKKKIMVNTNLKIISMFLNQEENIVIVVYVEGNMMNILKYLNI